MPQNVYGAQTACAVPGYQGYGPAGGMGTYGGGPGTYGSAGHYPDQGQGIQQTGGFQPAPPPPREIDDNDNDNQQ